MRVIVTNDAVEMGRWVASHAAEDLRHCIASRGHATIVVATGASQFTVLEHLIQAPEIDWSVVTGFHLDEYVGLSPNHPASFCRYLKERFVDHVPLAEFHYLVGDRDPRQTIDRIGTMLSDTVVDVALVGIGENGHLAFNDPPADFATPDPYLIVNLDQPCRAQQVGEGWFATLGDVPTQAISMSVRQIMRSKKIYCSVPDLRKATAVRRTLEDPVSAEIPASILRQHPAATLVVDRAAASQLSAATQSSAEQI
jgi:glucosamine-6-phosphate deaminase